MNIHLINAVGGEQEAQFNLDVVPRQGELIEAHGHTFSISNVLYKTNGNVYLVVSPILNRPVVLQGV